MRAEESPIAAIPDVPSIYDLAKTEEQRQLMRFVFSSVEFGRPYVLPPETLPELVALMRKAMADALTDPELVAEAARLKLDMTYRPPDVLMRLVENLYQHGSKFTAPELIERLTGGPIRIEPYIRYLRIKYGAIVRSVGSRCVAF